MTKDEAIEAERAAFITAYRLWCYSAHPDSHPEMVLSMAESHWGRAAGAMWLAAKRSIPAAPICQECRDRPRFKSNWLNIFDGEPSPAITETPCKKN